MAYMQLSVKHADVDLHSAKAAVVQNPAWRLIWALASVKDPGGRVLVDGFYDGIMAPTVTQREIVCRDSFDRDDLISTYGLTWPLLADTQQEALEAMVFEPTCTVCGFEAGYTGPGSKAVLPRQAKAKIDCRLVPGQNPQRIFDAFRKHFQRHGFTDVELEPVSSQFAYWTDPEHPFVDLIVRTAREAWEAEPRFILSSDGTGPMYGIGHYLNVPIVSTGCGYGGSRTHASDENIRLVDFEKGIRHIALVLHEFGQ